MNFSVLIRLTIVMPTLLGALFFQIAANAELALSPQDIDRLIRADHDLPVSCVRIDAEAASIPLNDALLAMNHYDQQTLLPKYISQLCSQSLKQSQDETLKSEFWIDSDELSSMVRRQNSDPKTLNQEEAINLKAASQNSWVLSMSPDGTVREYGLKSNSLLKDAGLSRSCPPPRRLKNGPASA